MMLQDNLRLCDVCGETIPKGKKYAVNVIPKDQAQHADLLLAGAPDEVTRTVDANGNLRLDICLDCKLSMSISSENAQ